MLDNIKMNLKDKGTVDSLQVDHDVVHWEALVIEIINLLVPLSGTR
jgi:hypothetical protein